MQDLTDLPRAEGIVAPKQLEQPPETAGQHAGWLPRHRKSVSEARRMLRKFLTGIANGELFSPAGELVLSELMTNAVVHARTSPGRKLWVRFEVRAGQLRVEVHDASRELPRPGAVTADAENGRGLLLVDQLSQEWGCVPRTCGIGKVVFAVIGPAAGGEL